MTRQGDPPRRVIQENVDKRTIECEPKHARKATMSRLDEIQSRIDARMAEIDQRINGGSGRMDEIQRKIDSRVDEIGRRIGSGENASTPSTQVASGGKQGFARSLCRRIGLSIGLNDVDPAKYGGPQPCPGCAVDATDFHKVLCNAGFESSLLVDQSATWDRVSGAIKDAANKLVAGDLFVVAVSGHGGSDDYFNPATAKTEKHESWCLYDGRVVDVKLIAAFGLFKPGVRIVVINDQCHAGGMLDTPGFSWAGSLFGRDGLAPMLIQFAACRADQTSIGTSIGGTWMTALMKELAISHDVTWREWFDKASVHMSLGKGQTPQWVELGPVTELFRQGRVLV